MDFRFERIWTSDWSGASINGVTGNVETFRLQGLGDKVLRELVLEGANRPAGWRLERDYIHRDGQLLASVSPSPAEGLRHYHLDYFGTPRVITDAAGRNVQGMHYRPNGEAIIPNNLPPVLQFTGHERDYNTSSRTTDDLDYMHARFHSPLTGRMLSFDPGPGNLAYPRSCVLVQRERDIHVEVVAHSPAGPPSYSLGPCGAATCRPWRAR